MAAVVTAGTGACPAGSLHRWELEPGTPQTKSLVGGTVLGTDPSQEDQGHWQAGGIRTTVGVHNEEKVVCDDCKV
jgi:NAD-dependent dihydropyrimidine dehydrogenase PreA subunit